MKVPAAIKILVSLGILWAATSCTADHLVIPVEPNPCDTLFPTYETEVKPILDQCCSYAGCHVSGFTFGNFSSYENLLPALKNGAFRLRVIQFRSMPPGYAPGPKMEPEERAVIECWLEHGFPEN